MAYRRRRRRFTRRKPHWTTRANRAMGTASKAVGLGYQVYRIARKVKLLNVEVKNIETGAAAQNITEGSSASTMVHVTPVAQGDLQYQRNGNSIKATSIHLRAKVQGNPNAGTVGNTVRVLLIQQKYTNTNTAPILSDVLAAPTGAPYVYAYRNISESRNTDVLMDKTFTLTEATGGFNRWIDFNQKLAHHLKYDGTAATAYTGGQLFLCFFGDKGTDNFPTITYQTRFRYVDN